MRDKNDYIACHQSSGLLWAVCLYICVSQLLGCAHVATKASVDIIDRAAPAFEAHWDYSLAGQAAPYALMQLEGLLRLDPDNKKLIFNLVKSYTGYAYGWIEDRMEQARQDGEFLTEQQFRDQAVHLYKRAFYLAQRLAAFQSKLLAEALKSKNNKRLQQVLAAEFQEQAQAEILFWLGYPLAAMINLQRDDPDTLADLPLATTLIEQSVSLDASYYFSMGLVFLGFLACDMPAALGGRQDIGYEHFERAMRLTRGKAKLVHINYARSCAVARQDKEKYVWLLQIASNGKDYGDRLRMANKIAKRRALRYLTQTQERFP